MIWLARLSASGFLVENVVFFFAMLWAGPIWAMPEKICDGGVALFQCQVDGGRYLALCPNYVDGALAGVQYRFGREKNIELVFPEAGFVFDAFKSNHFVRYQVDYKVIKFQIGSYVYGLYSNYDGEGVGSGARSAGVVVSDTSKGSAVQVSCEKIYVDDLEKVIPHLECDVDDALGCVTK
ncbi:hypothetical protein HBO15_05955 [Pseudomonas sp. WS 5111]|uniref:hypothetical protein n=1 Tax=unclassified Pseudomonas TaxID=196821 RepID=UPI001474074F|nr:MULTISPECIES: hypothetical protein [unclassified Pseudomonas]NMX66889.1 hypothetical protein [Pseudomonas sp. WS 5111]NMX84953.1 hypothetical protein [Pseudomonas sp. WS 5010]